MYGIGIGESDFRGLRIRKNYYIDKSMYIKDIIDNKSRVVLVTRPRRFGKTLNMSMLKYYFDCTKKDSKELFDGLKIMEQEEKYTSKLGYYPCIYITLKDVNEDTYEKMILNMKTAMLNTYKEHMYLLDSDKIYPFEKEKINDILYFREDEVTLKNSIKDLSEYLSRYYDKPVMLFLDEYDVPLAKASSNGYYKEMLDVMKTMMSTSLKDNSHLQFAVVTGCLKIAKESIFTGTNNFISDTIIATHLNEYFGFTDQEVKDILKDIGLQEHFKEIKEWYDGYNFGKIDVYCPWDVMNYVRDLRIDPDMKPASYWKNTSDNAIIRSFIDYAGSGIQKKMEKLMAGDTIDQKIEENLTYDYLHSSEENFWSILYLTGYLTRDKEEKESADGKITLKIPNKEIREIFETTVQDWFSDTAKLQDRKHLFDAVWNGDEQTLTQEISRLLRITISYHDYREDFYHAFLAGIFAGAGYSVESNKEHGEGRSNLVIFNEHEGKVAVFEAKYSKEVKNLEEDCEKAIQQIDHRMYAKEFEDSYDEVICYGISFYKKRCVVKRDVK